MQKCQVAATRRRRLLKRRANTEPAAIAKPKASAGWRLLNSIKRKLVSPHNLLAAAACTEALRGRCEKNAPSPPA